MSVLAADTEFNDSRYPFYTWVLACTDDGAQPRYAISPLTGEGYFGPSPLNEQVYALGPDDWFVGHNIMVECKSMGLDVDRIRARLGDTLLISWLLEENGSHSLDDLVFAHFGEKIEKPVKVFDSGKAPDFTVYWRVRGNRIDDPENFPEVLKYCQKDTSSARQLFPLLWDALPEDLQQFYLDVYEPYLRTLVKTESKGVCLDLEKLAEATARVQQLCVEREAAVYELVGYELNLNSPAQIRSMLYEEEWFVEERQVVGALKSCIHKKPFDKCKVEDCPGARPKYGMVPVGRPGLGLKVKRWTKPKKGQDPETFTPLPSTDKIAMEMMDHPVAEAILSFREVDKVLNTYLLTFPRRMWPPMETSDE